MRYYTVFNVEQCEGLSLKGEEPIQDTEFQPYELAERILSLPTVKYGGDRAYYDPVRDWIVLPPREAFRSSDVFYSVALHETTHWTGHETRLARQFGQRFGDLAYAFEELVAEMGSAFLCAQVGVGLDGLQHPEYVASWLRVLKGDKRAIFTAAREAQKASDWLLERVQRSFRNEAGVAAEIAA
ncbi:MAG TPA: hypothetical protein ENF32_04920 [Thermosulfidibacter takaii]|uniref:Polyvalent protein metallopeptidase domain-containing protein n=1 Tax=Thermosulfidibacter takaii TaxID=412593 RepID=A0A7C0U6Z9_9BACT|nr:hypothetical protein [Thermosulfidibacter takaii]